MILPCACTSKYQDRRYGPGRRVHNKCGREKVRARCRCTVCGNVPNIPRAKAEQGD